MKTDDLTILSAADTAVDAEGSLKAAIALAHRQRRLDDDTRAELDAAANRLSDAVALMVRGCAAQASRFAEEMTGEQADALKVRAGWNELTARLRRLSS